MRVMQKANRRCKAEETVEGFVQSMAVELLKCASWTCIQGAERAT
jgi:hypothetical protein